MSISVSKKKKSGEVIDVLIPAIEKDLGTLPYVIDSVRREVKHPIGTIYIVSPSSERIRKLCARKGCVFVDERRVLPFGKSSIQYSGPTWNRSGWLYQQLLKLSGDRIVRRNAFLVMDADTVLIRPHRFRIGGRTIYYCRKWSQPEYFRTYRRLMGRPARAPRSFVTHYMLFEKQKLRRLKRSIEARHGRKWYRAVLRSIDRTKNFGFSEFETYGNYIYSRSPGSVILRASRNRSLHRSASSLTLAQRAKFARRYRSLSFHKRSIYARKRTR